MRLLFLGDVVGRSGRQAVLSHLPRLRADLACDFVVVNAENAAAGFGLTGAIARQLFEAGADCLTTGNHVWDQRELLGQIDAEPRILRPANYPPGTPGRGAAILPARGDRRVKVADLMAPLYMDPPDAPFAPADRPAHGIAK